jgi:hypothetical protein
MGRRNKESCVTRQEKKKSRKRDGKKEQRVLHSKTREEKRKENETGRRNKESWVARQGRKKYKTKTKLLIGDGKDNEVKARSSVNHYTRNKDIVTRQFNISSILYTVYNAVHLIVPRHRI